MKIICSTGGSGGHIIPALHTAKCLRARGHEVLFVGSFGGFESMVRDAGFDIRTISVKGLNKTSLVSSLSSIIGIIRAIPVSARILKEYRPDMVCGFGGYGAFPVISAALFTNANTVIHEQNVVPGKANKLLAAFVNAIAISFEVTQKYLGAKKTFLTGCPFQRGSQGYDVKEIYRKFELSSDVFTVLVSGGSQGSTAINSAVVAALPRLHKEIEMQIIHVTGARDYADVCESYKDISMRQSVIDFSNNIPELYVISDLVISRAGAVTISELTFFNKDAIIIPYPYAGGHQRQNADILVRAHKGYVIEQSDLTPDKLCEAVLQWYNKGKTAHPGDIVTLQEPEKYPDEKLADFIESL